MAAYRHQHALAFHDSATTAEESNNQHENAGSYQKQRCTQNVVARSQRRIRSLRHLQPYSDAENRTAQQLPATRNKTIGQSLSTQTITHKNDSNLTVTDQNQEKLQI